MSPLSLLFCIWRRRYSPSKKCSSPTSRSPIPVWATPQKSSVLLCMRLRCLGWNFGRRRCSIFPALRDHSHSQSQPYIYIEIHLSILLILGLIHFGESRHQQEHPLFQFPFQMVKDVRINQVLRRYQYSTPQSEFILLSYWDRNKSTSANHFSCHIRLQDLVPVCWS